MSHSQKILKNTLFGILSKIVTLILNFLTRKLFIMFLSSELLGLNSLFSDLLGLLNLADLGLGVAVQFNLYKPIVEHNEKKISSLLNAAKRVYNFAGLSIIIIGTILSFFIQNLIKNNPYSLEFLRIVFLINVISNASSYFFVHKRLFMQAKEDIHLTNIIDIVISFIGSVLKIFVIIVFRNYYLYIIIGAIQSFAANAFISYVCDKKYPYLKKTKGYEKEDIKSLWFNLKDLIPNKISNYIFFSTDNTILSTFIGLKSVTLYTNYSGIVSQIFWMAATIASIIKVSFGNVLQESSDKDRHILFLNSYQLLQFFYSSFCGIALFCLLDDFVEFWYGEDYVIPIACVIVLTIDFFIHSMYQPLSMMLEALGEFKPLKIQGIISMILNIIISVSMVIPFGLIGPIIGTLVVDILTLVFRLYTVMFKHYRFYLKKYIRRLLLYIGLFIIEYVGLYYLCSAIVVPTELLAMMLKVIACFGVIMGLNVFMFRKTEEFYYLKSRLIK